jgi:hypothetical protein
MPRFISSNRLFGTRRRVPAAQACPLFKKAIRRADGIAWSRAASSRRTVGDLPPSSSVTRFIVAAPSRMIDWPTPTEPVKRYLGHVRIAYKLGPDDVPTAYLDVANPVGKLSRVERGEQERPDRCAKVGRDVGCMQILLRYL